MMEDESDPFDKAVGTRLRELRQDQALTLDELAMRAGVSRAMISRIERAEANPTAQLLARLCHALGTTLSRFFSEASPAASPVRRAGDQHVWQDPATGYIRRAVSPEGLPTPVDIVDVTFPPGARVLFEPQRFERETTQHLWLLEGRMSLTAGETTYELLPGDCLFMRLADGIVFSNPHDAPARYAIILHRGP